MVFLYILKNNSDKFYIGITKLEPEDRLKKYNKGGVSSTKFYRPWILIYIEKYGSYQEARQREKQLKSWKGGEAFKKFIKNLK